MKVKMVFCLEGFQSSGLDWESWGEGLGLRVYGRESRAVWGLQEHFQIRKWSL